MIFVTGATGFVGKNLVKKLAKDKKIRCLVRKDEYLGKNIEIVKGDLTDKKSLIAATKNISTIIHLASLIRSNNLAELNRVNVKGTKDLVNASINNGVKKIIYLSSFDVKLKNKQGYGNSKLEAEKIIKKSGLDYIILRPTVIYGIGDKENLNKLFKIIKKYPFAPVIGNGKYQLQPVYIDDVTDVIIKCIDLEKNNRTYFIAGPKPLTFDEIIDETSEILAKKVYKIHFPLPFLKIMLKPYEVISKYPSLTYDKLSAVTENKTCDISKSERELDFKPINFEEGLKKTIIK